MMWAATDIVGREKHRNPHLWHDLSPFRRPSAASLTASPDAAVTPEMPLSQPGVRTRPGALDDGSGARCWRGRC